MGPWVPGPVWHQVESLSQPTEQCHFVWHDQPCEIILARFPGPVLEQSVGRWIHLMHGAMFTYVRQPGGHLGHGDPCPPQTIWRHRCYLHLSWESRCCACYARNFAFPRLNGQPLGKTFMASDQPHSLSPLWQFLFAYPAGARSGATGTGPVSATRVHDTPEEVSVDQGYGYG